MKTCWDSLKSEVAFWRAHPLLATEAVAFLLLILLGLSARAHGADQNQINAARWQSFEVQKHRMQELRTIVGRIERARPRYEDVSRSTGVPWTVIAGLHNMEASGSFMLHLHEGSSLRFRTRYVPIGRPLPPAQPPFSWEYSAKDALLYDKMHLKNWRDIGAALTAIEFYNGSGYARHHPETPSPYLWAATTIERPGKYVADGKWSPTARSAQIGVAAILQHFPN